MEEEKKQGRVRLDKKISIEVKHDSMFDSTYTNASSNNLQQYGSDF